MCRLLPLEILGRCVEIDCRIMEHLELRLGQVCDGQTIRMVFQA